MACPLWIVDAFTAEPFAGNPAAVCVLREPAEDPWMQLVARELGLSETAFLYRADSAGAGEPYHLRWFTPATEVELCGHATLASAHVLWSHGLLAADAPAVFDSLSGRLGASRSGDWVELDFPAFSTEPATAPDGLVEALGAEPVAVSRCGEDYVVELAHEETVRVLRPDPGALRALPLRGVIVTAPARQAEGATAAELGGAPSRTSAGAQAGAGVGAGPAAAAAGAVDTPPSHHFVSRFFAPGYGLDEDPVTGFAHCILGPYWSERLGHTTLVGYQASARGGYVRVSLRGGRAFLGGQAVTVVRGELLA